VAPPPQKQRRAASLPAKDPSQHSHSQLDSALSGSLADSDVPSSELSRSPSASSEPAGRGSAEPLGRYSPEEVSDLKDKLDRRRATVSTIGKDYESYAFRMHGHHAHRHVERTETAHRRFSGSGAPGGSPSSEPWQVSFPDDRPGGTTGAGALARRKRERGAAAVTAGGFPLVAAAGTRLDFSLVKELCEELEMLPGLTKLDLADAWIHPHGAALIGTALEPLTCIQHLDLGTCRIRAEGLGRLAPVLSNLFALTHLDLSHNNIGDVGATALGDALRDSHALTVLGLDGNQAPPPPPLVRSGHAASLTSY